MHSQMNRREPGQITAQFTPSAAVIAATWRQASRSGHNFDSRRRADRAFECGSEGPALASRHSACRRTSPVSGEAGAALITFAGTSRRVQNLRRGRMMALWNESGAEGRRKDFTIVAISGAHRGSKAQHGSGGVEELPARRRWPGESTYEY